MSNLRHLNLIFKANEVFHISNYLKHLPLTKIYLSFFKYQVKCNIYIFLWKNNGTFNDLTFVIICQSLLFNLLRFLYLQLIICLLTFREISGGIFTAQP